jgi:hypothetical protein
LGFHRFVFLGSFPYKGKKSGAFQKKRKFFTAGTADCPDVGKPRQLVEAIHWKWESLIQVRQTQSTIHPHAQ